MKLDEFVYRRRRQLGVSQAEIAKRSKGGISPASICEIEKGQNVDLRSSMIFGLAKGLGVKPAIVLSAIEASMKGD